MSVRARRWALDGAVRAMTATTTTREGWMRGARDDDGDGDGDDRASDDG